MADIDTHATREHGETISALNTLLALEIDSERLYAYAAGDVTDESVSGVLRQYAQERRDFVRETSRLVESLGGAPRTYGSVRGTLRSGWMDVRAATAILRQDAVLDAVERSEDVLIKRFTELSAHILPPHVRVMLTKQQTMARRAREHVHSLHQPGYVNPTPPSAPVSQKPTSQKS